MVSSGGAYNAGTAHVKIKPKLDRFAQELRAELAAVNVDHSVDVTANTTKFAAQIHTALAGLPDHHEIRLDVIGNANRVRTELDALTRRRDVDLHVDHNGTAVDRELGVISRDRKTNVDVGATTAAARREIDKLTGRRKATIRIEADTSGAQRAIIQLGSRMKGLDRYQRRVAMQAAGFTLLGVAAAGAVGPVSALASAIASAASAGAALPGILGGALAGFAGLKIGMSGVGGAFSAMGKSAGGGGGSTERAMKSAQKAAESAARGVERAHRAVEDAERGVVKAYQAVEDAERDVERAHRDVADSQRGVVTANRGVRDSERDLLSAQKNSRDAQQDLNRERENAVDNLRDMNEQLQDAALDEEGAVLAVARARQRLLETRTDPKSSQLDTAEADLAYRQSVDRLDDIRRDNNELAANVAATNRAGVEGAEGVVNAREKAEEAQWGEVKAAEGLEQAQYDLGRAHRDVADSQQGVIDAQRGVADAQQGVADSYRDLDDAQQGVIDAQESLADALADVGEAAADAASGGVDPFAEAMAKLSPKAREFVLAIRELTDEWRELKMATQDALFDGMADSVTGLAERQLPVLQEGLTNINTEINRGLRTSIAEFSTEVAALDFEAFLANTANGFGQLAGSAQPLSRIWMDLATVGSEYLPRLGDAISDTVADWAMGVQTARHNGGLNAVIDEGIEASKQLASDTKAMWGVLSGVYAAASAAGTPYSGPIRDAIEATHEWVDSMEGQSTLRDFFSEATTAVGSAVPVIKALIGGIAQGLVPAVEAFVTGIAPGLTQFVDQLSDNVQIATPFIGQFGEALGGVAGHIAAFYDASEPLTGFLFGMAEGFMAMPTPIMTVIGLLALSKWTKFGTIIDGLRGKVGNFTREMDSQRTIADQNNRTISDMTAMWQAAETRSSSVKRMGEAFRDGSTHIRLMGDQSIMAGQLMGGMGGKIESARGHAIRFSGTLNGTVAAGLSGMRSGAAKVTDFFGGPWMVAMAAAMALFAEISQANKKLEDAQKQVTISARDGVAAQGELMAALAKTGGEMGQEGLAAAARVAKGELSGFVEEGEALSGWLYKVPTDAAWWERILGTEKWQKSRDEARQTREEYKALETATTDLGIPMEELNNVVAEGGPEYETLITNLRNSGESGVEAATKLEAARAKIIEVQEAAANLSPEIAAAEAIFKELAGTTGEAADRANKLRKAYMELRGVNVSAKEAAADLTEEVARVNDKVRQAAEGTNEFANVLLDASGQIDTTTDAGAALWGEMDSIAESMQSSVASGNDANEVFGQMSPALEALRGSAGLSKQEWDKLLESLNMTPEQLTVQAKLEGATEIEQKLGGMTDLFADFDGKPMTKSVIIDDAQARTDLDTFGFDITKLNEETGAFDLTLKDEWALQRLGWWRDEGFPALDGMDPNIDMYLNDDEFLLSVEAAKYQLITLDGNRPNPLASMDISLLSDEAVNALNQVDLLDGETPTPNAGLTISDLTREQQIALAQVFDLNDETPTPIADMDKRRFDDRHKRANDEIKDLTKQTAKPKADIDDSSFFDKLGKMWDALTMFNRFLAGEIFGDSPPTGGFAGGEFATGGKYKGHGGYRLPTSGPGTNMIDGFMAYDSQGMPAARLDAGEWIINRKESRKHHNLLAAINAGKADDLLGYSAGTVGYATGGLSGTLPKFASGGIIQSGVEGITPHQQGLWDIIRTRFPDAQLSSAKRYWGTNDHHDGGTAIDMGGGWANNLQAIASWIASAYPNSTELFWDPGPNIKNGRPTSAIGGHSDHVHWAMSSVPGPPLGNFDAVGGRVQGGAPLTRASQFNQNSMLDQYLDEPEATTENVYGLLNEDLTGVGAAVNPLTDLRTTGRGDPNSYDGRGNSDLPTTWGGLAVHVATPFIEGQVSDILSVLGLGNELPGAVKAYHMVEAQRANTTGEYTSQALLGSPGVGNSVTNFAGADDYLPVSDGYTKFNRSLGEAGTLTGKAGDPTGYLDRTVAASGMGSTYDPSRGVEQWEPTVRMAMQRHGMENDPHIVDITLKQIQIESNGDPDIVNNWDSNAAKGIPSAGLLQVIEPTFQAMRAKFPDAMNGLPNNRTHPLANVTAGIGWAKHAYGGPKNIWPTAAGYATGGDVWGPGGPTSDSIPAWLSNGEHVTKYASAAVARPLLNAMNDNPALAAGLNQAYTTARTAADTPAAGTPVQLHYHINANNVDEGMRRAEAQGRRQIAAMSGR